MSTNQVEYGIRINIDGDRAASAAFNRVTESTTQLGATAERTSQTMGAMNGQMSDTAAIMRKNADASSAASEAAQKFIAPLQRQIDLFGANRSEIERYNAAQAGLSATTQRQAAALGSAIDAMQRNEQEARNFSAEQDRAARAADQFIKKLNDQVATLGMSAQQLQAHRAAQLGVSDAAAPLIAKLYEAGAGANTAGKHMEGLNFQTVGARRELLVLAHELSQGNFQKFGGSMMVLGEQTGAAGLLFSSAGLAALSLVAALGGVAYAAIKGAVEQKHMSDALIMTGNYAGLTGDSLNDLAHAAVAAGGSIGEAKKVATELAGSGKFTGDQIGYITEATVAWEHATGQSVKSIIKDFESLAVQTSGNSMRATEAISRATIKLDDQYHFLTESVYEQIRALEKEGNAKAASALATETFAKATHDRADEISANLGSIARGWNGIKQAIGGAVDAVGDWGKKDTEASRVRDAQKYVDRLRTEFNPNLSDGSRAIALAGALRDLSKAQEALNAVNKAAADKSAAAIIQSDAVHAASRIATDDARLQKKGVSELHVALSQYADDVAKIKAANPGSALVSDEAVAAGIAARTKAHAAMLKGNDDRAKLLQDALVIEQTGLDREKGIYDSRDKMLTLYHTKFGTSDAQFYAGREAARAEYVAAEAIAFAKESALIKSFQAKNPEEIAANKSKYDTLLKQHLEFTDKMRIARGDDAASEAAAAKKSYDDIVRATHDAGVADIKYLDDAIAKQKERNAEIGKTQAQIDLVKEEVTNLATVQMQSDADFIRGAIDKAGFDEAAKAVYTIRLNDLDEEIKRRKELAGLLSSAAVLDANAKAAADAGKAWKRTSDTIETDMANAILDGGGKGAKKLMRDMELGFAKMVLKPLLQPIARSIATAINPLAAQAAGASADGSPLGAVGSASSLYNLTAGLGSTIAAAGNLFGSAAISSFGAGLSLGSGAAPAIAAYNAAGMTTVGSAMSAGSSITTAIAAIPGWGWAALGAAAIGAYLFNDGPEKNTRLSFGSNNAAGAISINERGNEGKNAAYIDGSGKSDFGTFGVVSTFWMNAAQPAVQEFIKTVTQTDDALATFLTATEKASVASSLTGKVSVANTGAEGSNPNASGQLDKVFADRITNILAAVEPGLATLVQGFSGTSQALATEAGALLQYRKALDDSGAALFGAKVTLQEVAALKGQGELASAALARVTNEYRVTNLAAQSLGKTGAQAFGAVGLASVTARERLLQLSGGIDALSQNVSGFAQNYLTEAERLAPISQALGNEMADLGLSSVTTRAQFKQVALGLDLSTESGAKQYAAMMKLQEAFAQVHPELVDTAAAATRMADALSITKEQRSLDIELMDAIGNAEGALAAKRSDALAALLSDTARVTQAQIWAAQDAAKVISRAQASAAAYTSFGDALVGSMHAATEAAASLRSYNDALKLGSLSALSPEQKYQEAKHQRDTATADMLQEASTAFLQASKDWFGSGEGFARDYASTQAMILQAARDKDAYVARIPDFFRAVVASGALDGSHESGIAFVPKNGYRAELHYGERVQTRSEVKESAALNTDVVKLLQEVVTELQADKAQRGAVASATLERLDEVATRLEATNRKLAQIA